MKVNFAADLTQTLADCRDAATALELEHDLFEITLRTINKACQAGAPSATIITLVEGLVEHCCSHFLNEETFMTSRGYLHSEKHAASHRHLKSRLELVRDRIVSGDSEGILILSDLLLDIRNHIDSLDLAAYQQILESAESGQDGESQRALQLARLNRLRNDLDRRHEAQ